MVDKLKRVFGRVDVRSLCALALGFFCFTLVFSVAQEKDSAPFDEEEYKNQLARRVSDIYELESWFTVQRSDFQPLLPPFADFVLTQPGLPQPLLFEPTSFPKEFVEGLTGIYDYSTPVFPILMEEDPKTRALNFYNSEGKNIYTLLAPPEYDPFAYLKERMPGLYTGKANPAARTYWESLFDPARIRVTINLIASDDLEHWLYAKAKVEASLQPVGEGSMMMRVSSENSTTNIQFTQIKKATNGVSLTISYPSGFTNGLDVFMCSEIVPEIWSIATLALPTTGTNLTWVDTNSWVFSGIPVRMYAASDATLDTDGDGYPDGREIMVYDTDPNAATSRPVRVSGSTSYSGTETGTIYVLFNIESNNWSLAKSLSMATPGSYTNSEISNYHSYWFSAFRDANGNFTHDTWEPWGAYSTSSTLITGDTSGINITLQDVPSVWGQISYSGTATGNIYAVAVAASNSWDMTYQAVIPWVQSAGMTGDEYYASFPVSYSIAGFPASNYWIRAFVDEDYNTVYTPGEPVGQYAVNATPVSNRLTGINITLNLDSDGDGVSDVEELQAGGDPANASDGGAALAEARQRIIYHWNMTYSTALVFTNAPGTSADLVDLNNALQSLSGKFQKMQ